MPSWTIAALIEAISQRFEAADLSYGHGTDNAWDEAVALVLAVTGAADDQASLVQDVSAMDAQTCLEYARRRVESRQPLAYLLGHCRYMGYEFHVRPGVVVPRSPIGYLLFDGLAPWLPARVDHVVDLCSGSGCLGILAALRFPQAEVTLVELDEVACAVAAENIALHGLQDRVQILQADVTAPLTFAAPADLVVANPPYVDAADMGALPAEFQAEPALGLGAGDDGLAVIGPILQRAHDWLAPQGLLVGEVGASARALNQRYPGLAFVWLDLPRGGEGVFVLEAASLSSHTAPVFH